MIAITEATLTRAWLTATDALTTAGRDAFSLVVSIADPSEPTGREANVRAHLDKVLAAAGLQDTQTVAKHDLSSGHRKGPERRAVV